MFPVVLCERLARDAGIERGNVRAEEPYSPVRGNPAKTPAVFASRFRYPHRALAMFADATFQP